MLIANGTGLPGLNRYFFANGIVPVDVELAKEALPALSH
jgi:hypothetical protein